MLLGGWDWIFGIEDGRSEDKHLLMALGDNTIEKMEVGDPIGGCG